MSKDMEKYPEKCARAAITVGAGKERGLHAGTGDPSIMRDTAGDGCEEPDRVTGVLPE